MGSTKMIGKTIGEVEKLTGIPKRKLKYMIERNLMQPSQRTETGFWLYSEEDIRIVRTITLFQQLGCAEKDIYALLAAPASQWTEELNRQIARLMEKKNHIEDQLFLAELLRHRDRIHADASAFSPIENRAFSSWKSGEKASLCRFLLQTFSEAKPGTPLHELSLLIDQPPDGPAVQEQIRSLCGLFHESKTLSSDQLLLILRLACTLSGLVPVLDALLCAEETTSFLIAAMEYYCKQEKETTK